MVRPPRTAYSSAPRSNEAAHDTLQISQPARNTHSLHPGSSHAVQHGAQNDRRVCFRCKKTLRKKSLKRHFDDDCEPTRTYRCLHCHYCTSRKHRALEHHESHPDCPCTKPCQNPTDCATFEPDNSVAHYALGCGICGDYFYQRSDDFIDHWRRHKCTELPAVHEFKRLKALVKGLSNQPNAQHFWQNVLFAPLRDDEHLTRLLNWALEPNQSQFLKEQGFIGIDINQGDPVATAMVTAVLEGCPTQQTPDEHVSEAFRCLEKLLRQFNTTTSDISAAYIVRDSIEEGIRGLQPIITGVLRTPHASNTISNTDGTNLLASPILLMDEILVGLINKLERLRPMLLSGRSQPGQTSHYYGTNPGIPQNVPLPSYPPSGPTNHTFSSSLSGYEGFIQQERGSLDPSLQRGTEGHNVSTSSYSNAYGHDQICQAAYIDAFGQPMEMIGQTSQDPSTSLPVQIFGQPHINNEVHDAPSWTPDSLHQEADYSQFDTLHPRGSPHIGPQPRGLNPDLATSQLRSINGYPIDIVAHSATSNHPYAHGEGVPYESAQNERLMNNDPSFVQPTSPQASMSDLEKSIAAQFMANQRQASALRANLANQKQ